MGKKNFLRLGSIFTVLALSIVGARWLLQGKDHRIANGIEAKQKGEVDDDGALRAHEWRALAWRDGAGNIPRDGLIKAMKQRSDLVAYRSSFQPRTSPTSTMQWTNLGPTNISGRGRAISIDPVVSGRILEASVGGGIWKSTDSGTTFAPVNDLMSNLAICCLDRDPEVSTTLYAGTGEGFFNIDQIQGNGLYKSTDNGDTWSQLAGTNSIAYINRVSVSPSNSSVVILAGDQGLYRSTNGGANFTRTLGTVNANGTYVAFNPTDGTKAVATVMDYNFSLGNWVYTAYYSTDGGQTWHATAGSLGSNAGFYSRIELAYAPSNPTIVYASDAARNTIWKSTDGGQSYTNVTTSGSTDVNGQGWYDNCISVCPTDPNFVVAGGVTVWKSTNGGQTISHMGDGYNGSGVQPHPDTHALVFDPNYNGTTNKNFYVYTDGGTYMTSDATTVSTTSGWTKLDKAVTVQLYGIAGDATANVFIGGAQDNGTQKITTSGPASLIFGGDGGFVAMDPSNYQYQYGEYVDLQMFRTSPSGTQYIFNGISDAGSNANFIAPFILDPNDPNKMWAGGASLWLSTNVKAASPSFARAKSAGTDLISAVAVAPGNSNVVWVGQNDGGVAKSANALAAIPTWNAVTNNSGGKSQFNTYITRIYIDPSDATSNTVYVARGGFTAQNVWKTTDGGTTWVSVSGSGTTALPSAPVRGFTRDPNNAQCLFAGTEVGVFWSNDGGNTWSTTNVAPANVSVDELSWANNGHVLLAATHGRGFYRCDFNVPPPTLSSVAVNVKSQTGGLSATGTITLGSAAQSGGTTVSLTSSNAALTVPASVTVPSGATTVTFTILTVPVGRNTPVTISASLAGVTKTVAYTVLAPVVSSVAVSPFNMSGGSSTIVTFTVTLGSPAPTGGFIVGLSSSNAAVASMQSSFTVPAGGTTGSVRVTTHVVTASTVVSLSGNGSGITKTAKLTVNPPGVSALTFSPTSVAGSLVSTGTVTLAAAAPTGGQVVTLSSNNAHAAVPANVTVAAGATTATFSVTTATVTANTTVTITASSNSVSKTATVTVTPPTIASVAVAPYNIKGSSATVVTFTVNLTAAAPNGGQTVTLASDTTSAATMPATVVITAGSKTGSVTVSHVAVAANTTVTLSASTNSTSKSAKLTLTP